MSEQAKKAAVEIPKGWDGEPVIKFPVHYEHGFVIDSDKQIVCNLLWHSHRVNFDVRDEAGKYVAASLNAHAEHTADLREKKFKRGDRVRKINGSSWRGIVVGEYSTEFTPEGYAVESEYEKGSVQIYPAAALEKNDE